MTTFNPKIALRILEAKQKRLDNEAYKALATLFRANVEGHWYDEVFYELDRAYRSKMAEANGMYDVLDYLRNRIEEEACPSAN